MLGEFLDEFLGEDDQKNRKDVVWKYLGEMEESMKMQIRQHVWKLNPDMWQVEENRSTVLHSRRQAPFASKFVAGYQCIRVP